PSFDFFYPNIKKNNLWPFLFATYDSHLVEQEYFSKSEKENFLIRNNLGMVNLIESAYCENGNSDDAKMSVVDLKPGIVEAILESQIKDIYFTSTNTKNLFWLYLEKNSFKPIFKLRDHSSHCAALIINGVMFYTHTLPNPTNRGRKGET